MAEQRKETTEEALITAPVVALQEIGIIGENLFREVGSIFWFIINTIDETFERVREGRVPFRAASFFRYAERSGVESVPLVALVSFFLGLTMALLTGYQLQRFGTDRHHARSADRCRVYRRVGHDDCLGRSGSDRSDGNWAAPVFGCAANARSLFPDAMSFHHLKHRGDCGDKPDLESVFQHCLPVFYRSCPRLLAYPRPDYRCG
jgi:hypothetical protein